VSATAQQNAFATGVLPDLYAFTATPGIPSASTVLEPASLTGSPGVEPRDFTGNLTSHLRALYASDSGQRSHPPYYRGCWHGVSRCFLWSTVTQSRLFDALYSSPRQWFTTRRPSSHTRRRCVSLAAIAQYSPLLPPVGVWAVSQSQCGWPSSQTSYPSSPWWALPANKLIAASPSTGATLRLLSSLRDAPERTDAVLPGRWAGYPPPTDKLLTCYAPICH